MKGQVGGRRLGRWVAGLLLAALLNLPGPAPATEPPLRIAQYAHTAWTARDGALLGLVFSIAQTPDGYLWIAGSFGLFRFDGLRFVRWQPPAGQTFLQSPYSLLVSRDGTLWIGTFDGLFSWDGTRLKTYPGADKGFVTSLLEDREGTLWAGLLGPQGKLCAVRAGQADCDAHEGRFGTFVWSLAEDSSGALWAGAQTGVWRWKPGPPRRFDTADARVGDLSTGPDGRLLVALQGAGLRQLASDRLLPLPIRKAEQPHTLFTDKAIKSNKLMRDREGALWIGTDGRGLLRVVDGKADVFTRTQGLSGNIACSLFEDREGNIWYGSDKGLDRFRRLSVTTISTQQGLPSESTKSVLATTDGSVWVATNDGLARWKDDRVVTYGERDGLPDARVHSLFQAPDGRLWVSTARGVAYQANGRFVAVRGLPGTEVYSITGDASGNLWLSSNAGLLQLHQGRFVALDPWSAFGRTQQAKVVVADRGGVWLAFWQGGGVMYFKDGRVVAQYATDQGLGAGHVSGLRLDAEGAVWAATEDGGLSRIKDDRVTTLTVGNGLPCNAVHWSEVDNKGSLWMHTGCGLLRVMYDDLAAWVADPARRVTPKVWASAEGVPIMAVAPAYFNPPVARAADGKLWFVSGSDVHLVDPNNLPSNPLPPPVHIESLVADHQRYLPHKDLRLPPRVRDLTIEFAALSFVDPPNMRFRYRLVGHDTDWQDAVNRREATYTNLPPGDYRFQVTAANNSGVWNAQGAALEFSIEHAFYETPWFRVVMILGVLGAVWAAFFGWLRLRIRRLRREFDAALEGRVAERTRIARDLHDTLLQRFNGLLLLFQAASNLLPDRAREAKQVLAGAIDQAAEAITEGRDTVQDLRGPSLETSSLAQALKALAEDLAGEHGHTVAVQVALRGHPLALHPLVRDETFRIAGEALRNAFCHAQASRIEVEVRYEPGELLVRVSDDGRGMEPDVLRAGGRQGHFGLRGMRERADIIGGTVAMHSAQTTGTEVTISVPGTLAYSRPPAPRWRLFPKRLAHQESGT